MSYSGRPPQGKVLCGPRHSSDTTMKSEPTLYQRGHPAFEEPVHWDWLDELVRAGVLVPVELKPQQWCEIHDTIANCEEGNPGCVLIDTAPTLYVIDPDPLIGGDDE